MSLRLSHPLRRTPASAPAPIPAASGAVALADLPPGSRASVAAMADGTPPATAHRLIDLGFTAGTPVEVVRRAPLRDPVVYRLRDYEVCLRRDQARYVLAHAAG